MVRQLLVERDQVPPRPENRLELLHQLQSLLQQNQFLRAELQQCSREENEALRREVETLRREIIESVRAEKDAEMAPPPSDTMTTRHVGRRESGVREETKRVGWRQPSGLGPDK